eukprot:SAG22_NODE_15964_length_335_cov_12.699153_1_plen_52_part_01
MPSIFRVFQKALHTRALEGQTNGAEKANCLVLRALLTNADKLVDPPSPSRAR